MKISKATIRDIYSPLSTRAFATDKGFDLTYDAGLLQVRHTEHHPGKVFMFPLANVIVMEAVDEPKKK